MATLSLAGIPHLNTDAFAKGGVKQISLCKIQDATGISVNATTHVGAVTQSSAVVVDFERESAKMSVSLSKSDAVSTYTISIEGYCNKIEKAKLAALEALSREQLIGVVEFWDGYSSAAGGSVANANKYLVGWDRLSSTSSNDTDFGLELSGIELDSGSALSDTNGVTLTFSCVQAQMPATLA